MFLAGCAIGPNYKRPVFVSPAVFRGDSAPTNSSFADLDWWQIYQDTTLQALVREALTNNYDLRIAVTRVEQARALALQARSQFVPSVSYDGTVSRGRNEVFLASEEARHGVRLSLLGEVAADYCRLLELDQELEIASRTANSFTESLRIFSRRVAGGTASALEAARAEAALADATAAIPAILDQISSTENQLCLLMGRTPGPIERSGSSVAGMMPPSVPAGLPSSLLERRPDVREAEQLLRSANAQMGESIAAFFPRIGLTTLLGKVSPELSAFTLGSANAWGIAASGSGPLFEGGRLVGQYRQAKAARDEALLGYKQTALSALRDVSDALTSRERLGEVRERRTRQVTALGTAVRLSSERYVAGKASYYEVLEAQQQLFPAELNLARTQRDELLTAVALYKALGGGWHDESDSTSASSQSRN